MYTVLINNFAINPVTNFYGEALGLRGEFACFGNHPRGPWEVPPRIFKIYLMGCKRVKSDFSDFSGETLESFHSSGPEQSL